MVTRGNWLQWHNWLAGVKFGQEEMRASLEALKNLEREIEDYFGHLKGQIGTIQEKCMANIRELQAISEKVIKEAISETTSHALDYSYSYTNPLAKQIVEIACTGQCDMYHFSLRAIELHELEAAIGPKLEGKWLPLPDSPVLRSLFPDNSVLSGLSKASESDSVLCGPKADSAMMSKAASEPNSSAGEVIRPLKEVEEDSGDMKKQNTQSFQLCLVPKSETDYIQRCYRKGTFCYCDGCFVAKVKPLSECGFCAGNRFSGRWRDDARCLWCRLDKHATDFQLFTYLQHSCKFNTSAIPSNMRASLVCIKSVSEKDLEATVAASGLQGKRCPCGNLILEEEFSCPQKCFCSVCHLTNLLLNCTEKCPVCTSKCMQSLPKSLKCSRCLRRISELGLQRSTITKLTVSGVCFKGHILCQHCVQVNESSLSCPVCQAVVQGKPASELREAQRKLFIACYCEEVGNMELVDLECGHVMHRGCKESLESCRICGREINYYWRKSKEVAAA